MALYREEDEYIDDDLEEFYPVTKKRKSTKGRSLMRWDVEKDQLLLLTIEHVCLRDGVAIPWDAIGALLTPKLTAEAIKQHLAKVRKARIEDGYEVPPPLDKSARRKSKAAPVVERNASPIVIEDSVKEEAIAKRSTLLPPPKHNRKVKAPRKTKRKDAMETSKNPEAPVEVQISPVNDLHAFEQPFVHALNSSLDQPYMQAPTSSFDQPFSQQSLQSIAPAYVPMQVHGESGFPTMTADQQQLLEYHLAQAEAQRQVIAATRPPPPPGIRNDVFFGASMGSGAATMPITTAAQFVPGTMYGANGQRNADPRNFQPADLGIVEHGISSTPSEMLSNLPIGPPAPMLHSMQNVGSYQPFDRPAHAEGLLYSGDGSGQSSELHSLSNTIAPSPAGGVEMANVVHGQNGDAPFKLEHAADTSFNGNLEAWADGVQSKLQATRLAQALDQSEGSGMLQHAAWLNATNGASHDYNNFIDQNAFE